MKLRDAVSWVHENTDHPRIERRGDMLSIPVADEVSVGVRGPVPDWVAGAQVVFDEVDRPPGPIVQGAPDLSNHSLVPDALAYYLPFHRYVPSDWGIYVLESGLVRLALRLGGTPQALDLPLEAAFLTLFEHERFHCTVETGATRLEVLTRAPIYRRLFVDRPASEREEALANAVASRAVSEVHPALIPPLHAAFAGMGPGYRDFGQVLSRPDHALGRVDLVQRMQRFAGLVVPPPPPGNALPVGFVVDDVRSAIPLHVVLDGRRRGLMLPDAFVRRELAKFRKLVL